MLWADVILWLPSSSRAAVFGESKFVFCAVFDKKRQDWELSKGGFEPWRRKSSGCADAGLFATARWELWEEAGWWLSYREQYW